MPNKIGTRWSAHVAVLVALVLGIAMASFAAVPQGSGRGGGYQAGRRHMPSVDDQIKRLTQKLQLNEDQQGKVKTILEDQRKQMSEFLADSSLSKQDRRSKVQDLRDNTDNQIKGVLNEDQQKKFEEMRQKRRGKRAAQTVGASDDK